MKHYPRYTGETFPRNLVLANGSFPQAPAPLSLIDRWCEGLEGYTLTCCDGGVNKLRAYTDKLPDAVVGDLDSVSPALKSLLQGRVHHIPEQETNDLTKTFTYIHRSRGRQTITLLGASGGREDHLLGNLSLLTSYAPLVSELVMLTDEGYFILITEPSEIEVLVGQQVSIFNFSQSPVTLQGVRWSLQDHTLPALWCGTLNCAIESLIQVSAADPVLIYLANV